MAIKINPFHQVLWRTPTTLQIGAGAKSVVISDITPAQERVIDALYYGLPPASVAALAAQSKLGAKETESLLAALNPVLVRADLQARTGAEIGAETGAENGAENGAEYSPEARTASIHGAEVIRAALDNQADAVRIIERRKAASVHIQTLDATGLTLTLALAAAGVGTITSGDSGRVTTAEASSNLYPYSLQGRLRISAAKLILEASWPGSRLMNTTQFPTLIGKSTVAVVTNHQTTPTDSVTSWLTRDIATIEIRYQPDGAEVSPVLLASAGTGCLLCREHFAQDSDDSHIAVISQLITSKLRLDDAGTRLVACGLAVQEILAHIDAGLKPGQLGERRRIGYRYVRPASASEAGLATGADTGLEPTVHEIPWLQHPACSCAMSANLLAAAGL
jgi:hypothetical protein